MKQEELNQFFEATEDINNDLHYYWEDAHSELLSENFILNLN